MYILGQIQFLLRLPLSEMLLPFVAALWEDLQCWKKEEKWKYRKDSLPAIFLSPHYKAFHNNNNKKETNNRNPQTHSKNPQQNGFEIKTVESEFSFQIISWVFDI